MGIQWSNVRLLWCVSSTLALTIYVPNQAPVSEYQVVLYHLQRKDNGGTHSDSFAFVTHLQIL